MLPLIAPDKFCVIAHRGASAYAPENTAAAFRLAATMGIEHVELDTQLSADGQVVLCHDRTLQRYGHGDRPVEGLSSTQLLSLDMGSWFSPFLYGGERMLSLDQLLRHFGQRLMYHVELKGEAPALPQAVQRVLATHGIENRCIITSFSLAHLHRYRALDASCRLAWLVEDFTEEVLAKAAELNLYQLCPRAEKTTPATVATGRRVAQQIRAWGVSGTVIQVRSLLKGLVAAGCDGATLNWPDWIVHATEAPSPGC